MDIESNTLTSKNTKNNQAEMLKRIIIYPNIHDGISSQII